VIIRVRQMYRPSLGNVFTHLVQKIHGIIFNASKVTAMQVCWGDRSSKINSSAIIFLIKSD